jgi:hypothetical protein
VNRGELHPELAYIHCLEAGGAERCVVVLRETGQSVGVVEHVKRKSLYGLSESCKGEGGDVEMSDFNSGGEEIREEFSHGVKGFWRLVLQCDAKGCVSKMMGRT